MLINWNSFLHNYYSSGIILYRTRKCAEH